MTEFLNLNLVHSLSVLMEEGTFTRAAERLHITPPAMTQQIQRLESAVGLVLVERGTKPVRLTAAGERFMEHASVSLTHARLAMGETVDPELRIGFINGYPAGPDAGFLGTYRRARPDIRIRLLQVGWGEQVSRLVAGDLDASLARPPYAGTDGLDMIPVHVEPRVVGVPVDSPLAHLAQVTLADLDGYSLLGASGAAREWTRFWVVDPRPSGVPVRYGAWVETMEEALNQVAFEGHLLMTAASVATRLQHPGVVYRPIVDAGECHVYLCTRRTDTRSAIRDLRRAAASASLSL
ncbi:LysR substrate-binding domain-containing protein [Microbacterium sp. NPDC055910]|uniref:LysR substrate-binding domain-containing protein n=1 Tax=Microbacterium sp. NPDC055910 TaxID=3345659 RepID=UPI0035DFF584